jgi:hypothetical protein
MIGGQRFRPGNSAFTCFIASFAAALPTTHQPTQVLMLKSGNLQWVPKHQTSIVKVLMVREN